MEARLICLERPSCDPKDNLSKEPWQIPGDHGLGLPLFDTHVTTASVTKIQDVYSRTDAKNSARDYLIDCLIDLLNHALPFTTAKEGWTGWGVHDIGTIYDNLPANLEKVKVIVVRKQLAPWSIVQVVPFAGQEQKEQKEQKQ